MELALTNNILHSLDTAILLHGDGRQKVVLTGNTILAGGPSAISVPEPKFQSVIIEAEGNLFDLRIANGLIGGQFNQTEIALDLIRGNLRWQGRNNLYCGPRAPAIHAKDEGRRIEGAWREFLG